MKIKGWHLIVLAIIIFFLDFLTLGNRNVINNPITNKIAFVIGLLCVFALLYGIIKTLHDFISKNKEINKIKWEQEEEKDIRATAVEIGLRRLLAILLIVNALPLIILLPFIGLILSLPILLLALYLLFNHRYHLVFDGFLVLPGLLFYFVTFSIRSIGNVSYFSLYKSIELSLCPKLITPFMAFINSAGPLAIMKYFFLTASLFLLTGDIIARLKPAHRKSLNVISLLTISLVLFFLPFLYVPKVVLGTSEVGGTGGEGSSHFLTNNASYHLSYDKTLDTYIFTANMLNQDSNNPASITNICVDGKIIPITKENMMLQVENGTISDGKILVAPGQTAIIKLVSQKPFFFFTLFEGLYRYSTNFLK
jgi:hypothetical protein